MILKYIIAYGRWLFGITPTFYQPQAPISSGAVIIISLAIILDLSVAVDVICWVLNIIFRKHKE